MTYANDHACPAENAAGARYLRACWRSARRCAAVSSRASRPRDQPRGPACRPPDPRRPFAAPAVRARRREGGPRGQGAASPPVGNPCAGAAGRPFDARRLNAHSAGDRSRHQDRDGRRPEQNSAPQSRALDELSDEYLGFAFFVRPAAAADARAVAAGDLPRAHWFWSVVAPLLVELQPRRDRGPDRQHAGAGEPAVHHERLRSRRAERRDRLAGRAGDRHGASPSSSISSCAWSAAASST